MTSFLVKIIKFFIISYNVCDELREKGRHAAFPKSVSRLILPTQF